MFETTCVTGGSTADYCATSASGRASTHGGIFLADFDRNGESTNEYPGFLLCGALGFCTSSVGNSFEEVLTGPGDSGGANFLSDWTVAGVTSFGTRYNGVGSYFGFQAGYTCVANVDDNAGCQSNFNWVNAQLGIVPDPVAVPEPATGGLVAMGVLAMGVLVRRRSRRA